jgi:hypothetical protein
MTERDKKTIRIGAVIVAIYLAGFYGIRGFKRGESGRAEYQKLVRQAEQLQEEVRAQETKVLLFEKLSEIYKFDPRKLSKETLVAEASAAIQTAAQQGGVAIGPIRETPGRGSARELSTIQVEATGPVTAAMGLLHKLQTLGFPLIIESVQLTQPSAGGGPGRPPGMPSGGPPVMMEGGPPMMMMPPMMGGRGGGGALKMSITLILLNYDQFKAEGPNA